MTGPPSNDDILKDIDVDKLDWSQLNVDACTLDVAPAKERAAAKARRQRRRMNWSSNANANGSSAVTVKQSVSPFWDTRDRRRHDW